jgi:hypothetical protein
MPLSGEAIEYRKSYIRNQFRLSPDRPIPAVVAQAIRLELDPRDV